jgi:hypothetical protein
MTSGTASLASNSATLVCDEGLWHWLNGRAVGDDVRTLFEKETPSGIASIVTLG